MEHEIIWLGNIVRFGSKTPRYLYNETNNYIYFRTFKDHIEIAEIDKKTDTIYFNTKYKMQFKAIKRQIVKDYQPKHTSEYVNLI